MVEVATRECSCGGTLRPLLTSAYPAFLCPECGTRSHNAVCVDDDGTINCVCGLDDTPSLTDDGAAFEDLRSAVTALGEDTHGKSDLPEIGRRTRDVLNAIGDLTREKGYPPSVKEIGERCGMPSSSTVHGHLVRLQQAGYVTSEPGQVRTLVVVGGDTADAIVRDLASACSPLRHVDGRLRCALCWAVSPLGGHAESVSHKDDCPWQRAVRLVAAKPS